MEEDREIGSDGEEEKEQEVAKRKKVKEGIRGRTESGGKEGRRKI